MGTYGRNFEFRVPPTHGQRAGRQVLNITGLDAATQAAGVPIGAPIKLDNTIAVSSAYSGAYNVQLATGAQAPVKGGSGILLYEHAPAAFAGYDPALTTYSDIDKAPVGKLVQMISGLEVKVVFKNTDASTFLGTRSYAGRIMVAGVSIATPSVAVGELLTPGTGTDAAGYWAETGTAANGWLEVLSVDAVRDEVEARMIF